MAAYNSSNPFYSDDSDKGNFGAKNYEPEMSKNPFDSDADNRRNQIMTQIYDSEDRQLESTRRMLMSLNESEQIGVSTAEELLRQGEQLDNIERKTAEMNQEMTTTQKHINNIKSVFGGVKNWWSGKKTNSQPQAPPPDQRSSRLKESLENSKNDSRQKKHVDTTGFGSLEEDDDLDKQFMAGSRRQMIQPVTNSHREKEIDENLGLMSDGLSKLKGLALGLGDEIEKQNEQIDTRINPQMDKLNLNLENQNREMKKILRK